MRLLKEKRRDDRGADKDGTEYEEPPAALPEGPAGQTLEDPMGRNVLPVLERVKAGQPQHIPAEAAPDQAVQCHEHSGCSQQETRHDGQRHRIWVEVAHDEAETVIGIGCQRVQYGDGEVSDALEPRTTWKTGDNSSGVWHGGGSLRRCHAYPAR